MSIKNFIQHQKTVNEAVIKEDLSKHSALGDIFNFQPDDIRDAAMELEELLKKKGFNLLKNPEVLDAIKELVLTAKYSKK